MVCMTVQTFTLATLTCLLLTGTVPAATVFTGQGSFLSMLAPGYYLETFQNTNPPTYLFGGFGYTATVSGGTIYDSGSFIGNFNQAQSFTLTFTTGNVTAVGGNFYLADINDVFQSEPLTITLSDGTTDTFTPATVDGFRGYATNGTLITSLTMSVSPGGRFNTLDNLIVGAAIPEPAGTGLLLGSLALGLRRRRA